VGSVWAAFQPGRVTHVRDMCVACRCTFRWLLFQSGLVSSYQRRRLLESLPVLLMLIAIDVGMIVMLLVLLGVRRGGMLALLIAVISVQVLEEPPRMSRRAVLIWRKAMRAPAQVWITCVAHFHHFHRLCHGGTGGESTV
jgi:hypothetical protein